MRRIGWPTLVALLAVGFVMGIGTTALTAERHPEIRAAQRLLAQAKGRLEHAAHDFQGHRVKAIQDIDEAQEQLRAALDVDRK